KYLNIMLAPYISTGRIDIINADYASYTGPLRNQADFVVAIAPNRDAPVAVGVTNFVKPGGQAQVITEHESTMIAVETAFGNRAIVTKISSISSTGNDRSIIRGTQSGLAFTTSYLIPDHVDAIDVWDIYIPSW
ncbi:hypothetical protein HC928_16990, partial [bacterium]|nr:hypothetical protein [bacterium]